MQFADGSGPERSLAWTLKIQSKDRTCLRNNLKLQFLTGASLEFLGTRIAEDLCWSSNASAVVFKKKLAQQRLHFLHHLEGKLLVAFCRSAVESVLACILHNCIIRKISEGQKNCPKIITRCPPAHPARHGRRAASQPEQRELLPTHHSLDSSFQPAAFWKKVPEDKKKCSKSFNS